MFSIMIDDDDFLSTNDSKPSRCKFYLRKSVEFGLSLMLLMQNNYYMAYQIHFFNFIILL